jgi:hypothetical protein
VRTPSPPQEKRVKKKFIAHDEREKIENKKIETNC